MPEDNTEQIKIADNGQIPGRNLNTCFIVLFIVILVAALTGTYFVVTNIGGENPLTRIITSSRKLLNTTSLTENTSDQEDLSEAGDFIVFPADEEIGIEERVALYGVVTQAPIPDPGKEQLIGRMVFSSGKPEVEVEVLFGESNNNVGVRWAPQGDVEANPQWTTESVAQVGGKIKKGDELIIYLALDEKVQALLDVLGGKQEAGKLERIGPVAQLIAGDYE